MRHTTPEQIDIPPELQKRIDAFREEHADDAIGDVASTVIFEDDKVRIWEMTLEPGEASDLHHHGHDYYLAILSGDLVAAVHRKGEGEPALFRMPSEGNTVGVSKGGTEWALNLGKETYHEILFELKNT